MGRKDKMFAQLATDHCAAQAEIARLTADLRHVISERDRTFALMLARAEKAEADLATARAETAMAYDRKNVEAQISEGVGAILRKFCESDHAAKARHHLHAMPDSDWNTLVSMLADAVVSTTAHATEALAADRKAVRAQALREAAKLYEDGGGPGVGGWDFFGGFHDAILALIEKEMPNEAR